jgi:hypothetical protein
MMDRAFFHGPPRGAIVGWPRLYSLFCALMDSPLGSRQSALPPPSPLRCSICENRNLFLHAPLGRDSTAEIGAKGLGLLAYLAVNYPKPILREKLAGALSSEKRDEAARYRLRHTLWELRRSLGDGLIKSDQ